MKSYVFVNDVEIYKSKQKISALFRQCLKRLVDNMKNTRLYRYVYNFSVDYGSINVEDILDIYKFE